MKKMIVLGWILMGALLAAGEFQPQELIQKEAKISGLILNAYRQGKSTDHYFQTLCRVHKELSHKVTSAEANEMLNFLDYCIADLNSSLSQPSTPENIEIVRDLHNSIQEGTSYLSRLSQTTVTAAR